MGVTTRYALRYPELDDPDDVPTDMLELATDVDAAIFGAGVPKPVVNGQWLKGAGGAAVWSPIAVGDVGGLMVGNGLHANRPAATPANAGGIYIATDRGGTWQSTGSAWALIAQRPYLSGAAGMPATPYDGEELILVDNTSGPSVYEWRLRYNAGSSSGYKWECIGGTPAVAYSGANVTNGTSLNTWVNLCAASIAAPRGGEYMVFGSCTSSNPTAGATHYVAMWMGSLPAGVIGGTVAAGFAFSGGYSASMALVGSRQVITAGFGVAMCGQSNVANGNWGNMQWGILPYRVQ